jgi:hypothetical protein
MEKFEDNLVCLDLSLVKTQKDITVLAQNALGITLKEEVVDYIWVSKTRIDVSKVFLWKNGDIFFVEFPESSGVRNISISIPMDNDLKTMKSLNPNQKSIKGDLVMVEPARFKDGELNSVLKESYNLPSLKKTVSKFWLWVPNMEIIFVKHKDDDYIDITLVESKLENVSVFGLNQEDLVEKKVKTPKKSKSVSLNLDDILDKINESGFESLSPEEKEYLKKY